MDTVSWAVAALEAAEARSHCNDPVARAALQRIAADETRHAQLAWRFVAWALDTGPASLRGVVRAAFARQLANGIPARHFRAAAPPAPEWMLSDGLPSALRACCGK
jgi:hypothetical protein